MAGISRLTTAFAEALVWGLTFGAIGAGEVYSSIDSTKEATHVALAAAMVAGAVTYKQSGSLGR